MFSIPTHSVNFQGALVSYTADFFSVDTKKRLRRRLRELLPKKNSYKYKTGQKLVVFHLYLLSVNREVPSFALRTYTWVGATDRPNYVHNLTSTALW